MRADIFLGKQGRKLFVGFSKIRYDSLPVLTREDREVHDGIMTLSSAIYQMQTVWVMTRCINDFKNETQEINTDLIRICGNNIELYFSQSFGIKEA